MIKRFLKNTRQKLSRSVSRTKRRYLGLFLPSKTRKSGDSQISDSNLEAPELVEVPVEDTSKTESQESSRPTPVSPDQRRPKKKKWSLEDYQVPPAPGKVRFHDIGLPLSIMRAVADMKFEYCTPVQAEALPHLQKGVDLVGNANTGTGKTAVFLIAILSELIRRKEKRKKTDVGALIIAPTRELVIQIAKDGKRLTKYTNKRIVAVYGGSDYGHQIDILQKGNCDIIVATPGRLLDFARKKIVQFHNTGILVIDEADRMLDMGFIPDVRRIVNLLPDRDKRQTLMFSATITEEVKRLASQWCKNPVNVAIEPDQVAVDTVDQKVYLVTGTEKYPILYNLIQKEKNFRGVVFANQKVEAKKLSERLSRNGIHCVLLTGDVPQKKRIDRLERFRSGQVPILVATDVAGRGIHIEGITHVINYSLPYEPEDYVHRIGRTGRAGADGVSISFACEEGGFVLPDIEEFIGRKLDCVVPEEEMLVEPPKGHHPVSKSSNPPKKARSGRRGRYNKGQKKAGSGSSN